MTEVAQCGCVADARPAHALEVMWNAAQETMFWIVIHWVINITQHKAVFSPRASNNYTGAGKQMRANEACIQEVEI